ncbi:hypothetical protein RRG08_019847 [Elysia crispata]|uniref:Uncharacterized protein n=1 Tax=Elysia crispata TaxID=231223 RepID=A0AAE1DNQ9_9GAST|nr:hypothetical protein RRG08_019847 [Elysia crispata]
MGDRRSLLLSWPSLSELGEKTRVGKTGKDGETGQRNIDGGIEAKRVKHYKLKPPKLNNDRQMDQKRFLLLQSKHFALLALQVMFVVVQRFPYGSVVESGMESTFIHISYLVVERATKSGQVVLSQYGFRFSHHRVFEAVAEWDGEYLYTDIMSFTTQTLALH